MADEAPPVLSMHGRATAAAGAALVAAAVVNPLDVIKTRIQVQAMAAAAGAPPDSGGLPQFRCVSTLYERWGITEGACIIPVRRTPPPPPGWPLAGVAAAGVAAAPAATAHVLPSSAMCACALAGQTRQLQPAAVAAAAVCDGPAAAGGGVALTLPGLSGSATSTSSSSSMWDVGLGIARREGLPVLWRGTWASLLIAVPMVGIYMPLYDALQDAWSPSLGGMAPVAAGTAARTAAVFAVAPFELLRTRLQASASGPASLRDTLAGVLSRHHQPAAAAAAGVQQAGGTAGLAVARPSATPLLRSLPLLWTGFSATLVRDVPFSALYWALVEPLRRAMLPRESHSLLEQPGAPAARSVAGAAASTTHRHSRGEILVANMLSGFIAGGVAAAVTTPFDVAKTRMQTTEPPPTQQPTQGAQRMGAPPVWRLPRVLRVLRSVAARDGLEGLFVGVKPRAARAAPACAIVISVYELLKDALAGG